MAGKIVPVTERVARARSLLARRGLDAVLATAPASIRWLSGMSDLRWMLVTRNGAVAMPSGLAVQAARTALSGPVKVLRPGQGWGPLADEMERAGFHRMGFEDSTMSVEVHARLRQATGSAILPVPAGRFFEHLREQKAPDERKSIRRASEITAQVASWLPMLISPGMTEKELAARVDSLMRLSGADAPAFETIALSGARTSMPHGVPGKRKIMAGDLVLVDFGAKVDGYHSDCTRTFSAGLPDFRQKEAYRRVYRAYIAARNRVSPGIRGDVPWRAAHKSLGGWGKYFIHGLGHGVGLEIHEAPSMSKGSSDFIRAGQFVTVEPGIYIPGWGGIRLEDTVVVSSRGAIPVTGLLSAHLPVAGKTSVGGGGGGI